MKKIQLNTAGFITLFFLAACYGTVGNNFDSSQIKNIQSKETSTFPPVVKNLFNQPKKRGCEWPEGHPDEPEFHFCGKERFEEKPYCLNHCAIAYIIPEKEEVEQRQIVNSRIK